MRVIDPGHAYELPSLDGNAPQRLVFVKRCGAGYPGNVGHHPGTTMQEVLRAMIERASYVNGQIACPETEAAIGLLQGALVLFELRAARRHGREPKATVAELVDGPTCPRCGHVGCDNPGHAREGWEV